MAYQNVLSMHVIIQLMHALSIKQCLLYNDEKAMPLRQKKTSVYDQNKSKVNLRYQEEEQQEQTK